MLLSARNRGSSQRANGISQRDSNRWIGRMENVQNIFEGHSQLVSGWHCGDLYHFGTGGCEFRRFVHLEMVNILPQFAILHFNSFNPHCFIHSGRVNWETSHNRSVSLADRSLPDNTSLHDERLMHVYVYSALMVGLLYVVAQKAATFFAACLRASRNIHNKLFDSVIHAKMLFFHTNASGRIINRFAQDIMGIDALLSLSSYDTVLVSVFWLIASVSN